MPDPVSRRHADSGRIITGERPAPGTPWHALSPEEALSKQGVEAATGLTAGEVSTRLSAYGPNKFAEAAKEPRWQAFLRQYRDPMQLVLLAAGIVSLFIPNQAMTGVVLIGLTLLNAFLGLSQEGKAEASVAALQKMMVVMARVQRGGEVNHSGDGRYRAWRHRDGRGGGPRAC